MGQTRTLAPSSDGGPLARRPDESRVAHEALLAYWRLGPDRSLRKLGKQLGKHLSQLAGWSSAHQWQQRVREQEERERQEASADQRTVREETRRRREANAEQVERVAMAGLRSLIVRDPETGEMRFDEQIKPTGIASLMRIAELLLPTPPERPGEEADEGNPLARLSDKDVQKLSEILEEAGDEQDDKTED
jgi:hypothetical protein